VRVRIAAGLPAKPGPRNNENLTVGRGEIEGVSVVCRELPDTALPEIGVVDFINPPIT